MTLNEWIDNKIIEIGENISNELIIKRTIKKKLENVNNIISQMDCFDNDNNDNDNINYKNAINIFNKVKKELEIIKTSRKINKKKLSLLLHIKNIITNNLEKYFYENITEQDIISQVNDYNNYDIIIMIEIISRLYNTIEFMSHEKEYLWFKISDFSDFVDNHDDLLIYDYDNLIYEFNQKKLNKIKLISCVKYLSKNKIICIDSMDIQESTKNYLKWLCSGLLNIDINIFQFIKGIDENDLSIITNICIQHYNYI